MKAFLFGQIGAGKSTLGAAAARAWGVPFHEADADLPPSVLAAIRAREPFTDSMRDEFAAILVERIAALAREHPDFIVAQGLFYNRQRHVLRAVHPELDFVWVRAQPATIEERLRTRTHPLADCSYARLANPYFEAPDFPHSMIDNDRLLDAGLEQFAALIDRCAGSAVHARAPEIKLHS